MTTPPKLLHLTFYKKVKFIIGLSPTHELPFNSKTLIFLYKCYGIFFLSVYAVNFVLLVVRLVKEIENPFIVGQSLSYTCLYIGIFAALKSVEADDVKELFREIDAREADFMKHSNHHVKEIFMDHIKTTNLVSKQMFYVTYLFCVLYSVDHTRIFEGKREFLYYQWFPFDVQKFYWFVLFNQCFYLMTCFLYIMYTKLAVVSAATYILANIKLLQHLIEFVEHYSEYYSKELKIPVDDARYGVLSHIVRYHNELIEFVKAVREKTNSFILLDFFLTSFQLGTILISIFGVEEARLTTKLALFYYFLINVHWMWANYYYGNEVIVESLNIRKVIYEKLNWYEYDIKTQKILILIMAKSQTPLSLQIGPLADLSLGSFLTAMKATYSYMTFMKSMYK